MFYLVTVLFYAALFGAVAFFPVVMLPYMSAAFFAVAPGPIFPLVVQWHVNRFFSVRYHNDYALSRAFLILSFVCSGIFGWKFGGLVAGLPFLVRAVIGLFIGGALGVLTASLAQMDKLGGVLVFVFRILLDAKRFDSGMICDVS